MVEKQDTNPNGRRKFLKTAAAISGGLAFPVTTAAAGPSENKKQQAEQRKYEELAKNRLDIGIEKFQNKLKKAGFEVHSKSYGYSFSDNGKSVQKELDGDISISSGFPDNDLTASVSIYEGRFNDIVDLNWSVDTEGWEGGQSPRDNITLAWSDNQYLYSGEAHQASAGDISLRTRSAQGAVWSWKDYPELTDWETENGYVSATLDSQDDCHTRHVYGTYEHTWSDVSITSISIGTGGVSIVYSDETKRWKVFPSDSFGGTC